MALKLRSPHDVQLNLMQKLKAKRLAMSLTQKGLALRSGVSLGSIKRFESNSEIALHSLLNIALILDCLDDFDAIATKPKNAIQSLQSIQDAAIVRKRGSIS